MNNTTTFLFMIFTGGGILLLTVGILIISRLYGKRSVEVDAECLDVDIHDVHMSSLSTHDHTVYRNTKNPVYRYYYNGKEYTSSPLLRSNRPGYHPQVGHCKIRINPDKPEIVYSSERKFAGAILIIIGASWLCVPILIPFLIRFLR